MADQNSQNSEAMALRDNGELDAERQLPESHEAPYKNLRFWLIFSSLAVTSLLTAVESTVTSTALPTISRELNSGDTYIWFVNAFFLSRYVRSARTECQALVFCSANKGVDSTAFQPLYGQLANVFGRRWPLISAVACFALGSGISGGASTTAMLIGGRTVQGIGLGGVNMLIDIVRRQSRVHDLITCLPCSDYMRSRTTPGAGEHHGWHICSVRRR